MWKVKKQQQQQQKNDQTSIKAFFQTPGKNLSDYKQRQDINVNEQRPLPAEPYVFKVQKSKNILSGTAKEVMNKKTQERNERKEDLKRRLDENTEELV